MGRLLAACETMGIRLESDAADALVGYLEAMAVEPQNLTAVRDLSDGVDRHLADSLAALTLPAVAGACAVVDVGSGAGFPGIALALARPELAVTLVEGERRKAEWLLRASGGRSNVRVVADRSELLALREREAWPVAAARALAPPPVALELLAPLVEVGGHAVLWRGRPDPAVDAAAGRAAEALGFTAEAPVPTAPFPGAERRLQAFVKRRPSAARFPRRPGRAAHRPLS